MPATIFTVCDLPSFVCYGSNYGSVTRTTSELLQIFATAAVMHSGFLKEETFFEFQQKYGAIGKKDSEQWEVLQTTVDTLAAELKDAEEVQIFAFTYKHSLNGVAGVAGSTLSTANAKIKENVAMRLQRLY